jgi:hypothetical protein
MEGLTKTKRRTSDEMETGTTLSDMKLFGYKTSKVAAATTTVEQDVVSRKKSKTLKRERERGLPLPDQETRDNSPLSAIQLFLSYRARQVVDKREGKLLGLVLPQLQLKSKAEEGQSQASLCYMGKTIAKRWRCPEA